MCEESLNANGSRLSGLAVENTGAFALHQAQFNEDKLGFP
jgi:hypothetical protein